MNQPLVSICIPTYNGERYLQEALDSVKAQTYKNIEVIISDDNSKDHTLEICDRFKNEVDFPVYIYNHTPSGIGANWNHCVEKANGEYIKFLFQDDILIENCLSEFNCLKNIMTARVFFCKRNLIDENSKIINDCRWYNKINDLQEVIGLTIDKQYDFKKKDLKYLGSKYPTEIEHNFLGEPVTSFIHKDIFNDIGKFNESLKQLLDVEYWLRILEKESIIITDKKLINFRIHNEQTSEKNLYSVDERKIIQDLLYNKFYKFLNRKVKNIRLYKKFPFLLTLRKWKYNYFS